MDGRTIIWNVQFKPPATSASIIVGPYTLPTFSIPVPQFLIDLKPTHVRALDYQAWYINSGGDTVGSSSRYGGAWEVNTNLPIDGQIVSDYTKTGSPVLRYAHFYLMNTIQNQYAPTQNTTDVSSGSFPDHWQSLQGPLPNLLDVSLTIPSNWEYFASAATVGQWTNRVVLQFAY